MNTGMRYNSDQLVPIEGSGGVDIPYVGYIEVKM